MSLLCLSVTSTLLPDYEQPRSFATVCLFVHLFCKPMRGQTPAMRCFVKLHLGINEKEKVQKLPRLSSVVTLQ